MDVVQSDFCNIRDEIEQIKADSRELKGKIQESYHLILYKLYNKKTNIKFSELAKAGLNFEFDLPTKNEGTVLTKLIEKKDRELTFNVFFSECATLTRHYHSDCDEIIKVTNNAKFKIIVGSESKGDLKVHYLLKGDELMISRNIPHQFTNVSNMEGEIIVKFIK